MNLLNRTFTFAKRPKFSAVEGYSDIKNIIERALETDENYNLLLVGSPASSKTLFLMGILDIRKLKAGIEESNNHGDAKRRI